MLIFNEIHVTGVLMAGEKILDIDDSPTVQRLIEMILTTQGYQVILASDGEEGVAKARAERPAVILVDFVMPKMNGFQVCKALKEDPEFSDTPIILVTSKGDKVGSKFVDVLGITEYFTKPFQPEELLAKIREVIDKKNPQPALIVNKTPARDNTRAAAASGPGVQAAQGVVESMVRNIVEQALDDFVKNILPQKIQQELAKVRPGGSSAGIQGNLASVPLEEVMQMLGLQRQNGKLIINRNGDVVEVFFKDGLIVFASSLRSGQGTSAMEMLLRKYCRLQEDSLRHVLRIAEMTSQSIDAILIQEKLLTAKTFVECLRRCTESSVYRIMTWKQGAFSFEKAAVPVFSNPIYLKVEDLLLEGARRADEWNLIQQKIPNFSVVFESAVGNAEELSMRGMSESDTKVFSLVNGRRTVQEIIDQFDLSEFDVAKSMFILLSVNFIRRKR
jgi:DNA-binding response OmpR family regulator